MGGGGCVWVGGGVGVEGGGGDTPLRIMVVMVVSYLEMPNKGQGKT